jgi:hypothetical protein
MKPYELLNVCRFWFPTIEGEEMTRIDWVAVACCFILTIINLFWVYAYFGSDFVKFVKEQKYRKQLIKDFLKEHSPLPKFSPNGQPLEWKISTYKTGAHDIYTGEQSGEWKVGVQQKSPGGILVDECVYDYDIGTKTLRRTSGRWR